MSRPLILVVEDNPTQQKLIRILSDRLNYTAQIVGSCTEMLETLTLMPLQSFSLVLMDWRLDVGDENGLDCTKLIREREKKASQRIPIIGMTAYAMSGDRQTCIDAGMDDYLSKPFTINQLEAVLDRWLPGRRAESRAV